ncbi:MAG: SdiA-regulated domain-containing protein [Moraxellaceae bacterium]|nr:SdiA-regulated domain-containing protein [Moraxellaceae bacterium]MDZ4387656.1 SdiA-regulated domain-containing protein [Moraxellaceae bacterium]
MAIKRRYVWTLCLAPVLLLGIWFKPLSLAYHWVSLTQLHQSPDLPSLHLDQYQVSIEAKPLTGIQQNLSGLTYNDHTNTLMGVTNRPTQAVEMSLAGDVLRIIPLHNASDIEGITHIQGSEYVVVSERKNKAYWIDITPDTQSVNVSHATKHPMNMSAFDNLGLEGVSWDDSSQTLYVVQEKWPMSIMTLNQNPDIGQAQWRPQYSTALFMSDLSSISISSLTSSLLLLSDESAVIAEYSMTGELLGMLPLWRGQHGLQHKVPQPEGVALSPEGDIFIVSEPNLFYRFERKGAAG